MFLDKFIDQSVEKYSNMVTINVLGVLNGVKCVLEGMIKRKTGTIVNVSSVAGKKAFSNHSAYNATKAAVNLFTEAIRTEVAEHNVRVM
jgi:NADP-dependent 3-hydroxy acid dehydrogenase YdfG